MVKLNIVSRGNKYVVLDQKERTIYTIKSGMGGKTHLINSGGYKLYYFMGDRKAKKPVFSVFHDNKQVFFAECTSLFLDPGFKLRGEKISIDVISHDRQTFEIIYNESDEVNIGKITCAEDESPTENAKKEKKDAKETKYTLEINEKYFDDYIPLIAVFIDIAFGELNKG